MPRFDYYLSCNFSDCDFAAKVARAFQAQGFTCFTDTFLTDGLLSHEMTENVLGYCDAAVFCIGGDAQSSDRLKNIADTVIAIGLDICVVKKEGADCGTLFGGYDRIRYYYVGDGKDEKMAVADIIADRDDDETMQMLRKYAFTDDNEECEIAFTMRKLSALCEAYKSNPEYGAMLVKGVIESAKLPWNDAAKDDLRRWLDILSFAKDNVRFEEEADREAVCALYEKVAKAIAV